MSIICNSKDINEAEMIFDFLQWKNFKDEKIQEIGKQITSFFVGLSISGSGIDFSYFLQQVQREYFQRENCKESMKSLNGRLVEKLLGYFYRYYAPVAFNLSKLEKVGGVVLLFFFINGGCYIGH